MKEEKINFVKVPIVLYNKRSEDLMNKEEWFDTYAKINLQFIMSYNPSAYERNGEMIGVTEINIGAIKLLVSLDILEFEKLINKI